MARCLADQGVILVESLEEVWYTGLGPRALGTWRECVDAITLLIGGGHAVQASFIKACVMQADGISEIPFCLDEVAEFLVDDHEARAYWQDMLPDERFPHLCPACGAAAYWGYNVIECKAGCPGR